jgi:nicotinate-nucleotide--dimethylbenzimidazole phosphoribosyltransferase
MNLAASLDCVLLDIGGTLVQEAPAGTAVADLTPRLLPRVAEDLAALAAQVPLAAVTNTAVMSEADVRGLLAPVGIDHLLTAVVTSADVGIPKPDPAPVLAALKRLDLTDPRRALLVGDLDTDRLAAAAAGCGFALVGPEGVRAAVEQWIADNAGGRFESARRDLTPPAETAAAEAISLHGRLTKPAGALGRLEQLGVHLAAMAGACPPPLPRPAAVVVFAADHGVVEEGVTPWPQEVTRQMVRNFIAGGAAINVLARQAGIEVLVVDVGVAGPTSGAVNRRVADGTRNLAKGAAMSGIEVRRALDVGAETAERLIGEGARCLITGDMGIGNTTSSAALISAFTGAAAADVTGRGTGIDDERLALKTGIVGAAAARCSELAPLETLAEIGGIEIAALAGFISAGAAAGVPMILDGVITVAAAVVAEALAPGVKYWCLAGHCSTEPGAVVGLTHLGLEPLLELGLRLGEGTGGVLAHSLVEAAARVLSEMATFAGAAITKPDLAR